VAPDTIVLSAEDAAAIAAAAARAVAVIPRGDVQRSPYVFRFSTTPCDWMVSVADGDGHLLDVSGPAPITVTPQRVITPHEVLHLVLALETLADPMLRIEGINSLADDAVLNG
jgi:hypothetical protein